jgi:hypothetical protein
MRPRTGPRRALRGARDRGPVRGGHFEATARPRTGPRRALRSGRETEDRSDDGTRRRSRDRGPVRSGTPRCTLAGCRSEAGTSRCRGQLVRHAERGRANAPSAWRCRCRRTRLVLRYAPVLNPALPALDVTGLLRAFVSRVAETFARALDPRLHEVEDLQREFSLMAAEQIPVFKAASQATRELSETLRAPSVAQLDVVRLSERLTTMRALRCQIVRPDPLRIDRLARDCRLQRTGTRLSRSTSSPATR